MGPGIPPALMAILNTIPIQPNEEALSCRIDELGPEQQYIRRTGNPRFEQLVIVSGSVSNPSHVYPFI